MRSARQCRARGGRKMTTKQGLAVSLVRTHHEEMKRWLGISLWAVAAYQKIGGRWSSATETSLTAKSGRKPEYLVRGGVFLRKAVAEDITDFQYLPVNGLLNLLCKRGGHRFDPGHVHQPNKCGAAWPRALRLAT